MSIRRESCDSCFNGRRKCDLAYPTCGRCQRINKTCHYAYPSTLPRDDTSDVIDVVDNTALQRSTATNSGGLTIYASQTDQVFNKFGEQVQLHHGELMMRLAEARRRTIPRTPCMLGELPPLSSQLGLEWVLDQIRDFPLTFANQAETMFIHKDLFCNALPLPLRTAFGICAGTVSMNERNRPVLFKILTAEISGLLIQNPTSILLEDLASLQAVVLYQIIRFFHGGLEQRIMAERQEYLVRSYALKLLQRADTELRQMQSTWETWIFAETIRRTVFIAFKLYSLYWTFKYGTCQETRAIQMLPVSTKPGCWNSRDVYLQNSDHDQTATYADFTSCSAAPRENLEGFEKLLLTGCKGEERLIALASNATLEG